MLDLVDTARVLLQFQLAYERAVTERARALAELRYLFGEAVAIPDETGASGSPS